MTNELPADSPNNAKTKRARIVRRILATVAWVLGGVIAVAVITVVLLAALINVDGVHKYLLGLAQRETSAMLGVPVTLDNFSVDFGALRVDLYGLTMDGATPYRTPPLLQVNRIEASARIVSLFHLKWYLDRVEVDHPVVWLIKNKYGQSNLPVLGSSNGKSNINLFSLAIRHALLVSGEIYLNDRPQSLNADFADLEVNAGYKPESRKYAGSIGYRKGRIQFGKFRPVSHSLDAFFEYSPGLFLLKRSILRSGRSEIVVSGNVKNFSQPEIRAHYDATIDGGQLQQVVRNRWVPSGLLVVKGNASFAGQSSRPLLERLTVNGEASSRELILTADGHLIPVRNVIAHYSAAGGTLRLRDFRAEVLGGGVAMEGTERTSGRDQGGLATAELHGISLADAERKFQSAPMEAVALSGTLNGRATASWGPHFKDLEAKVDAFSASRLARHVSGGGKDLRSAGASLNGRAIGRSSVPLLAQIHAVYTRENNRIELKNTFLRTQDTKLVVNGTAGENSRLALNLQASDLEEVETLASLFLGRSSAQTLRSLGLSGKASFEGGLAGALTAPKISGYLEGSNLTLNGSRWRTFHANVAVSPAYMRVEHAYLAPAKQGEIQFRANVRLHHWAFSKDSSIEGALHASRIKASELLRAAKESFPVAGTLDAAIRLQGSAQRPKGNGQIRLISATAYQQPVKSAVLSFSSSGDEIQGKSTVEIADGTVHVTATVNPVQRSFDGHIRSTGVQIGQLQIVKESDTKAGGVLRLNADGSGSFGNPNVNVSVEVPKAFLEGHDFSGINLGMKLHNRVVSASLSSTVADAPIKGHAEITLHGNYPGNLSLDTETVSLQALLALYAPDIADKVSGQTQLHMELHGPLKDQKEIAGEVTIPLLKLTYNKVATLATTAPIHIDYQRGTLRLQPTGVRGTDTDLKLQGAMPLFSKAPMSLQISGSVNLELAQVLYPDLRASGLARLDIHSGSASSGGMGGQIDIVNASLSSTTFPVGLQNGNGVLSVSSNRIDISKFNGTIGGGKVAAQGGVSLQPKLGFDLGMTARNVHMLYPQGMRENLNATVRLTGSTKRALLGGSVGISDVSFSPGFDLMSMVGQFSSGVSAPTAPGFSQNLALNVTVHSTNTLNPTSKTMNVAGTAALSVRGTAAHPALIGRVNLTGGSMIFHGDRFVLTSGTVQFVNPNQIRPVLNVSLTTTIQQYDIDLRFTGPVDQMHFEYTSTPSLPQADIISLLAFGTTTEEQAANPTPANQAAESLIASGVSSQVTSRISRIAGISQLSISPVLTSGTAAGPPGAVITIRQQVTGNLFITFSTNVASTQDETIQGEYRLSPRVSLSATRDPNGGFAIDALIKKSW